MLFFWVLTPCKLVGHAKVSGRRNVCILSPEGWRVYMELKSRRKASHLVHLCDSDWCHLLTCGSQTLVPLTQNSVILRACFSPELEELLFHWRLIDDTCLVWDTALCSLVQIVMLTGSIVRVIRMEVMSTSERSVNFYHISWCSIPEYIFILAAEKIWNLTATRWLSSSCRDAVIR
jgi:hypothetical protein